MKKLLLILIYILQFGEITYADNLPKFSYDDSFNPLEKENNLKRVYIEPSLYFFKTSHSYMTTFKAGKRDITYKDKLDSTDNSYNWAELTYKIFLEKRHGSKFKSLSPIAKIVLAEAKTPVPTKFSFNFLAE